MKKSKFNAENESWFCKIVTKNLSGLAVTNLLKDAIVIGHDQRHR